MDLNDISEAAKKRWKNASLAVMNAYYSVEDRYYEFLDMVDEKIPVYSAIDPVDRLVPSLVLFSVIGILLVGGVGVWIFGGFAPQPKNPGTNGLALEAISNSLDLNDIDPSRAPLRSNPTSNRNGSNRDPTNPLPDAASVKTFSLVFKNKETNTLITNHTVSFSASCSPQGNLSPEETTVGSIAVRMPSTCQTANISVGSEGFETYSERLAYKDAGFGSKTIELYPLVAPPQTAFFLTVKVQNPDGSSVQNALVRILKKTQNSNEYLSSVGEETTRSDGVASFSLNRGGYVVSAFDLNNGRFAFGEFSIEGADKSIQMTLDQNGEAKAVFLKVVESGTTEPVGLASVTLFLGSRLLFEGATKANGEFLQVLVPPSNPQNARAVIRRSGFITKVADVSFVNFRNPTTQTIGLTRMNANNSARLLSHAADAKDASPLPETRVNVFHSQFHIPLFGNGLLSNADGNVLFDGLPAGKVDVTFSHGGFLDSNVLNVSLLEGRTAFVPHALSVGKGRFILEVREGQNRTLVDGAVVEAFDGYTGSLLSSHVTETGVVTMDNLPVNHSVYFKISASGFLTQFTALFTVPDQSTPRLLVILTPENAIVSNPQLVTGMIWESDRQTAARTLAPGKTYWITFRILIPAQKRLLSTKLFVQDDSSNIQIENLDSPWIPIETVFSAPPNSNPYIPGTPVGPNAFSDEGKDSKQLNVSWGDLDGGDYGFLVKVTFPQNAVGTQRLKFGIKGIESGSNAPVSSQSEQTWTFGQIICTTNCTGQDAISWTVFVAPKGEARPNSGIGAADFSIEKNKEYSLWFSAFNSRSASISGANIRLEGDPLFRLSDPGKTLGDVVVANQLIQAGETYSISAPISFLATESSNHARLRLVINELDSFVDGKNHDFFFDVSGDRELEAEFLSDPFSKTLVVKVVDFRTKQPVKAALVKYKINAAVGPIASPDQTATTDDEGFTVFSNFFLSLSDAAAFEITAADYKPEWLEYLGVDFHSIRQSAGFSCLQPRLWDPWTGQDVLVSEPLPALVRNGSSTEKTGEISVDAATCGEAIDVRIGVFNSLADSSQITFSPSSMTVYPKQLARFSVSLLPTAPLGVVPVDIQVKRPSESVWSRFRVVEFLSLGRDAPTDSFGGSGG
ncbi:MAG: hypothetical protein J4215_05630 [Candidatus Diapherotrites archaeon]|uniref:Macroglobulin domain-containing protein n=1 Tax=Candidatus Iainarchaeum sp. TaxID=3101447 RepID=A0A8T4LFI6_9ARCH|nr:hypothetical protein [Candidatus Diapherotrites archaeon]